MRGGDDAKVGRVRRVGVVRQGYHHAGAVPRGGHEGETGADIGRDDDGGRTRGGDRGDGGGVRRGGRRDCYANGARRRSSRLETPRSSRGFGDASTARARVATPSTRASWFSQRGRTRLAARARVWRRGDAPVSDVSTALERLVRACRVVRPSPTRGTTRQREIRVGVVVRSPTPVRAPAAFSEPLFVSMFALTQSAAVAPARVVAKPAARKAARAPLPSAPRPTPG